MHKCNITLVAIYLAVLNATTVATSGKGLVGFGNVIGFVKPVYADFVELHDYYLLILGAIKAHWLSYLGSFVDAMQVEKGVLFQMCGELLCFGSCRKELDLELWFAVELGQVVQNYIHSETAW